MPRICVLQVIPSPSGGGAEVLVRELGRRVSSAAFDAEVAFFGGCGRDAVGCLRDNEVSFGLSPRNPLAIFKLRAALVKRLKHYDQVIVHGHLTWPFFYLVIASLFLDVSLLYTEHSTYNNRRKFPFFRYVERFFYARYTSVVAISEGVANSLSSWLGRGSEAKIRVIHNGVSPYAMPDRSSNLSCLPKLISIGSLREAKGFSIAIKAVSLLRDEVGSYTIVGEGPQRRELEALVEKEGLQSKVFLVGWSDNVVAHLSESDIQLVPSRWEGFGIAAIEGMLTGLPIVASGVAGLKEVLGADVPSVRVVTDYLQPNAWVSPIRELAHELTIRRVDLAHASRQQAEAFSFDEMVSKYQQLYRELGSRN